MNEPFIIDTHVHTGGFPFFAPEVDAASLLLRMDRLSIRAAVNVGSMKGLLSASVSELDAARLEFEASGGRLFYCGFFDPRGGKNELTALRSRAGSPGFRGIKIHPSFAGVPADDPRFQPAWELASERGLPIVAHSWSASSYNPSQALSTPDRFERFADAHPRVKLVLAHAGGRGEGRGQAIRMARRLPNVFMDTSGDISDRGFLESLVQEGLERKVLFGSDYPWFDPRSHLLGVYLARIPDAAKRRILRDNARGVFSLD
jgi:uncharacterized protein